MTLADTLAGRERRRESFTVRVSDPTVDEARAAALRQQMIVAGAPGSELDAAALEQELAAVEDQLLANYVQVWFRGLAPKKFERLVAAHTAEDGDVDQDALLPVLAAACAEDESLQDPDVWAAMLFPDDEDDATWTTGEIRALYHLLFLVLNNTAPQVTLPKG